MQGGIQIGSLSICCPANRDPNWAIRVTAFDAVERVAIERSGRIPWEPIAMRLRENRTADSPIASMRRSGGVGAPEDGGERTQGIVDGFCVGEDVEQVWRDDDIGALRVPPRGDAPDGAREVVFRAHGVAVPGSWSRFLAHIVAFHCGSLDGR